MRNILVLAAILGGGFGLALLFGQPLLMSGRSAIAAVFLFTGLGHFAKPDEMLEMIPPWVPSRKSLVWLSGIFELLLATGLCVASASRDTAITAIVFLILITPLNVYSAYHRVSFGGHAAGPVYLLLRIPFQVILVIWIYWFCLQSPQLR